LSHQWLQTDLSLLAFNDFDDLFSGVGWFISVSAGNDSTNLFPRGSIPYKAEFVLRSQWSITRIDA
jgi:hypothetical protein